MAVLGFGAFVAFVAFVATLGGAGQGSWGARLFGGLPAGLLKTLGGLGGRTGAASSARSGPADATVGPAGPGKGKGKGAGSTGCFKSSLPEFSPPYVLCYMLYIVYMLYV